MFVHFVPFYINIYIYIFKKKTPSEQMWCQWLLLIILQLTGFLLNKWILYSFVIVLKKYK